MLVWIVNFLCTDCPTLAFIIYSLFIFNIYWISIYLTLLLSTVNLSITINNILILFNFLSIVGIIGYFSLITTFINLTLLIPLVYVSLISLLFLVNGLIWIDCIKQDMNQLILSFYFVFISFIFQCIFIILALAFPFLYSMFFSSLFKVSR